VSETTNLFVWQTQESPRQWMACHISGGMGSAGESRDEVLRLFNATWAERAPLNIIDHAPPLPKRPDAAPQEDRLLCAEADSKFRRALLSAFHDDHHHGQRKTFSCDEIVATINRIWSEGAK
jgi:hypothetical protein